MSEIEKLADETLSAIERFTEFIYDAPNAVVRDTSNDALNALADVVNLPESRMEFIAHPVETASEWVTLERAVHVRGRYSHDRLDKLRAALHNALGKADRYVRFGTIKNLLRDFEVDRVRKGDVEYGKVEGVIAKRASTCRSCAEPIVKGEAALQFYWDFVGSGSWTAGSCMIHEAVCEVANTE